MFIFKKRKKEKDKRQKQKEKTWGQVHTATHGRDKEWDGDQDRPPSQGSPSSAENSLPAKPRNGGGGVGGKSHYLQRLLSPYEALWALHIFNTCTGRQVCLSAQERGKWAGGCLWDFKDLFANREAPGGKQWQHALRQWVMQVNNLLFGKASVFWRPCLTSLLSQLVKTGGWFVATNPCMRFGRCPLLTLWLLSLALRARLVGKKGEFGQHPQQL